MFKWRLLERWVFWRREHDYIHIGIRHVDFTAMRVLRSDHGADLWYCKLRLCRKVTTWYAKIAQEWVWDE